ncbi:MAG: hypothetical protein OCC49_07505 [Fibrobacterales bacterium]
MKIKSLLIGLVAASTIWASNWCGVGHKDYHKLTSLSGCMPRPVLLVHGFGADLGSIGGMSNENFVGGKTLLSHTFGVKTVSGPHNHARKEPIITQTYSGDVRGYKKADNIPDAIGKYYGAFTWVPNAYAEQYNLYFDMINENGIEFYDVYGAYSYPDESTTGQARQLWVRVLYVLNEYYGDSWKNDPELTIDIIGHSQGGMIIRKMIAEFSDPTLENPVNHINHVITVGTPNLGNEWATPGSGDWAVDYTMRNVDGAYNKGYFDYLPSGVGDLIHTLKDQESFWDINGDYIKDLSSHGNPYNYYKQEPIPITTFYSSCAGCAETLWANMKKTSIDGCDASAGEKLIAWGINMLPGNQGVSGNDVCRTFTTGVFQSIKEWVYDFDQQNCQNAISLADGWSLNNCDPNSRSWTASSDFVSSIESQQGLGVLSSKNGPYQAINLGTDVFHGDFGGIKGSNTMGYEILQGLLKPPGSINIVPTIITPLLLN